MRTTSAGVLLTIFLLTVSPAIELAAQHPGDVPAVPGQLFVKANAPSGSILDFDTSDNVNFIGDPALETIIKKFGIHKISRPFHLNDEKLKSTYLVEFSPNMDHQYLIATLSALDYVDYAEQVPAYNLVLTPDDLNANQWHLPQIMAEQAWDLTTGSSNVVVAIVDDAVLTSHEDLAPVIWTNTGEIPGNGIDDESNGYIDDVNGWDAANGDNDPNPDGPTNSYFTHGTHCAGITGAATNNSIGIASIGYNIQIMPVKTASTGNGTLVAPYLGVQYAIANNADIISMSWGGGGYSSTYQNLFDFAHNQGIVLIAAAGNSNSSVLAYPASYNHIISVGATNSSDQKAWFSNYGDSIDVMAPGKDIWSCLAGANTSYGYMSGTSMACPLVSGLAALMLSQDPSLSPDELEACLESSCDNIDGLNPSYVGQMGAGRINAYEALACLKLLSADFSADFTTVCPGDTVQFTDLTNNNPIAWQWSFPGGFPSSSTAQNPAVIYNASGIYSVTLIATNADSVDTIIKTNYITVALPTASMSGSSTIPPGYSANIRIDFTGNSPWSISYTDGTDTITINNITYTPYYLTVSPSVTTTYTILSVQNSGCVGVAVGLATIEIPNPSPSNDTICLDLQPDSILGKDACVFSLPGSENTNYGDIIMTYAFAWTFGGIPGTLRTYLDFDLSFIPDSATILSASLTLTADSTGTFPFGHSTLSGSNDAYCRRVTSSWDEYTITWNNQPTATTANEVILPPSIAIDEDYIVDVSELVQDMIDDPANSYGFYLRLITEQYYRSLFFASSDNLDPWRWPKLQVCYVVDTTMPNSCLSVLDHQKISDVQGGFLGSLDNEDLFGRSVCNIGDLNGDGITDIAVGAEWDDDGGTRKGAVWILFLTSDGTVGSFQKISETQGGFTGVFTSSPELFGVSVSSLGDLDGDGIVDLAVGAWHDDDGGTNRGAVWILFLNTNGTVKAHQKISNLQGNFTGILSNDDRFGTSVAGLGDQNNDGIVDLAVGANKDDDGGTDRGSVWILFLNTDGTVLSHQKISSTQGNFTGSLSNSDYLGVSVASLGDFNKDGMGDIVVGALGSDDGGTDKGSVWVLFLNISGNVIGSQKISSTQGGFVGPLSISDQFGMSVANLGDLTGDSIPGIGVGAWGDDDGGSDHGAIWILYMNIDGTVDSEIKISSTEGGFTGALDSGDKLATSLSPLGDFNSDGIPDLVAGARHDDDGGTDRGAVWIMFMEDTCQNLTIDTPICSLYPDFTTDTVCAGDSTQFTDRSIDSLGNIITWKWYFGDGDSAEAVQNPRHRYSTAGSFSAMLIISNDQSPTCIDTIIKTVLVVDTMIVKYPNDPTICLGDSIALGPPSIICGKAPFTYQWVPGTGLSYTTDSVPNASPLTTTTYYVTITDSAGLTFTDTVVVNVDTGCCVSWAMITSDTNYCIGDSVYLTNNSVAKQGATFSWDFGPNASPQTFLGSTPPGVVFSGAGTFSIELILVDSCGSDTALHDLNIYPTPLAEAGNDDTICANDSVQLGASPISFYSYLWNPGSGLTDSTIANPWFVGGDTSTYVVTITDNASGCFDMDTVTITVLTDILANAGPDTAICIGEVLQLSASGGTIYSWYPSQGLSDSTISDPIANIDTNSTYHVIVAASVCPADTDSIQITIVPLPNAQAGGNATIALGESFTLSGSGGTMYLWQPSTNLSCPNCQSTLASPNYTTTYILQVTDSNGCVTNDTIVIFVDRAASLYVPDIFSPNGDGENDYFYVQGKGIEILNMAIYDRWGDKVFENTGFTANDKYQGWDGTYKGKPVNAAVFVYVITGTFIGGSEIREQGNLTLVK